VFSLIPRANGSWTERILHSFQDGDDGAEPRAPLAPDAYGNLYGSAIGGGGAERYGVVFRLRQPKLKGGSWALIPLYAFLGSPDGAGPAAGVVFDRSGNLYSTTTNGGTCGSGSCGTVFEAEP
jgi:hypothetical protein